MPDITEELQRHVAALKGLVATYATSEVTNMLYALRLRIIGLEKRTPPGVLKLDSPARQQAFLLGLLLATEEPDEPEEFGFAAWNECVQLLNDAFGVYEGLFVPDGPGEQNEAWWRAREVAGPVFLHYFYTSLIATAEQVKTRIQDYCVPFDAELIRDMGISASDSLAVMDFVVQTMQDDERIMRELQPKLESEQERFIKSGDFLRPKNASYRAFMQENYPVQFGFYSRFERKGQVARTVIEAAFPAQADAFLKLYTISRGQGTPLEYPTDDSIFDYKPLVVEDDEYFSCPSPNNLFEAVLRTCEAALEVKENPDRRRYFEHRDKVLEREAEVQFGRLTGGQLYSSLFETPKSQLEHDLIVVVDKTVLVIEAKASPPTEPSRTPERAFERLRQSFRKDTGIQKGFEQAARIQRRLAAGETVPLYTRTGELKLTLTPQEHTECFCVCLTRDDFGHLATNLSLLLEKESNEPYPWAVNIWDLEAMADAWAFLGWGIRELVEYLRQRQRVQGQVLGSDELEFVGSFIHHDSLEIGLERGMDLVQLNPHYADFFDELHDHLRYGGPAPKHKLPDPSIMDIRKSLEANQPVFARKSAAHPPPRKLGRNDPCFCGSGLKYKKCHGR